MKNFMEIFHLKNVIKVPTCFMSDNLKCIDLILTNKYHSFQSSRSMERNRFVGISFYDSNYFKGRLC